MKIKHIYIQVKTLTYFKEEHYYMTNDSKYPDNMLMVMINKERTRFVLEFAGNIIVKRYHVVFNRKKKSKYDNAMFTNINLFIKRLQELINFSCTKLEFTNDGNRKEYLMLQRFKQFCDTNNIVYMRNATNSEPWDGTINGYKFQAKYVSINYDTEITYQVSSQKSSGFLNGKLIRRHYDEGDFDYMIVELGGTKTEPEKYKGQFCIIPSRVLIEQNILKTKTCKGKKGFYVCPPDYARQHWSKKFWNVIPIEL